MAYSTPDSRRRSGGSSHSSNDSSNGSFYGSGRPPERVTLGGSYHGPRGTQSRGNGRGGLRGAGGVKLTGGKGNSGYPLRTRSINFQGGRGRRMADRRALTLAALGVVLAILLVVGVTSCVSSCNAKREETQQQQEAQQSEQPPRVAAGISDDLTSRLESALDRNDKLAQIAQNADKYADTLLVELALAHPEAIDFVASYPDAEKTGQAFGSSVTKGKAPEFYCWDARWGAVDYGGHALAVSGSGPVAFSMAYMGLTGKNDKTPADIAALATEANAATGESGTAATFFTSAASGLGLTVESYESNAVDLNAVLDYGTYLLIEAKADTLSEDAHWILVVSENSDGTVGIYDPTDPQASERPWSSFTIASACDTFYAVSAQSSDSDSSD
ncbi:hypothetical protein [Paratractidigestivibacter sp.]|uniref:hypothetical protein n=1 Tax=Paratractidigestivibacter sp. TaxID=2847316 RepID=UPI002ACB0A54|nr:hypothetical protein [Paratractidigestivibacter sp.]